MEGCRNRAFRFKAGPALGWVCVQETWRRGGLAAATGGAVGWRRKPTWNGPLDSIAARAAQLRAPVPMPERAALPTTGRRGRGGLEAAHTPTAVHSEDAMSMSWYTESVFPSAHGSAVERRPSPPRRQRDGRPHLTLSLLGGPRTPDTRNTLLGFGMHVEYTDHHDCQRKSQVPSVGKTSGEAHRLSLDQKIR